MPRARLIRTGSASGPGTSTPSAETPTNGGSARPPNGNGPDHSAAESSEPNRSQLPVPYISPEERAAKAYAEARRLARMAPGEWRAFYRHVARDLDMAPRDFEAMIKEILKADKAAADARERAKKKLFDELERLQPDQHRERIKAWCEEHDEDENVEALFYEFRRASGMDEKPVWPTEVDGGELINEIGAPIDRYAVMTYATATTKNPEVFTAAAARVMLPFWNLMTYLHPQLAIYAPIPTPYGPKEATGKSTLMKIMSWMAKSSTAVPTYVVSPTKGIWMQMSTGDTMFIEEGQKTYRNDILQMLLDASWQYGVRVPRNGKQIMVFCQKMMAMLAPGNIPKASWSRHIPFLMMAKTESDPPTADFPNIDTDEFDDIRRKCERWMQDHHIAVYRRIQAKPEMPAGLSNRYAANWVVMFAIADEIGGEWPWRIRKAAMTLQRDPAENDAWHVRLLRAMRHYVRYVNNDDANKPVPATDFVEWLLAGCPIQRTSATYKERHWVEDKSSEWQSYRAGDRYQGQKITVKAVALEMKHWGWTSEHGLHNRYGSGSEQVHGFNPMFFAEHFERSIGDPLKYSEPMPWRNLPRKARRRR